MKKILFSDKYGFTQAVLDGRKTQTRRIAYISQHDADVLTGKIPSCPKQHIADCMRKARYKVGEVVAVAQSYESLFHGKKSPNDFLLDDSNMNPKYCGAGFRNKMFVRADLMPYRIRITDVRVERLNDISESDCRAEGIVAWTKDKELYKYDLKDVEMFPWSEKPRTPREAYAALIDRISGKGTWEKNPYVFIYNFELID